MTHKDSKEIEKKTHLQASCVLHASFLGLCQHGLGLVNMQINSSNERRWDLISKCLNNSQVKMKVRR